MENGPVGSFGEGGVADSFPADGAHRLFRYHATTGLEEYLLIGRLQMFGEEQRLEYLSGGGGRRRKKMGHLRMGVSVSQFIVQSNREQTRRYLTNVSWIRPLIHCNGSN